MDDTAVQAKLEILQERYDRRLSYDDHYFNVGDVNGDERVAIVKYVLKKMGVEKLHLMYYEDKSEFMDFIMPYLYFGTVPKELAKNEKRVNINGDTYIDYYFMWVKEGDLNQIPAGNDEVITRENFSNYMRSFLGGWSKNQILAFIFTEIIPKLNLNINTQHSEYRECFRYYNKDYLGCTIKKFLSSGRIDIHSTAILCIKNVQRNIKARMKKHISILRDSVKSKDHRRFKWENICSTLGNLNIEDLYELAAKERISFYTMMTKREICAELAIRVDKHVKAKLNLQGKCSNPNSIFTMESVNDISPEFFFSYKHNGQIYCDDIRYLHRHFIENGDTHPIDRTPVSTKLVNVINREYDLLVETTNTMTDTTDESDEPITRQSLLTANTSSFLSLLNYPNSSELFIDSQRDKFRMFLQYLYNEHILTSNEYQEVNSISDLINSKLKLLDIMLLKIRNDPHQVETNSGHLSEIAINTSVVYNDVFYNESEPSESELTESDIESF